jgi:hypothetical protein
MMHKLAVVVRPPFHSRPHRRISASLEILPSRTSCIAFGRSDHGRLPQPFSGYDVDACSWVLRQKALTRRRRFDHIFASARLQTVSCEYLAAWLDARLSDHAGIEAVFGVQSRPFAR